MCARQAIALQARLSQVVLAYDAAVNTSQSLAEAAIEIVPGVMLSDCTEKPNFDPGTLLHLLEQKPGCRVTVLKKNLGPIAALHGVQYSLAVAKIYQKEINLQKILLADTKSSPEYGVITNVSFLLHVCETIWNEVVLYRLQELSRNWQQKN